VSPAERKVAEGGNGGNSREGVDRLKNGRGIDEVLLGTGRMGKNATFVGQRKWGRKRGPKEKKHDSVAKASKGSKKGGGTFEKRGGHGKETGVEGCRKSRLGGKNGVQVGGGGGGGFWGGGGGGGGGGWGVGGCWTHNEKNSLFGVN